MIGTREMRHHHHHHDFGTKVKANPARKKRERRKRGGSGGLGSEACEKSGAPCRCSWAARFLSLKQALSSGTARGMPACEPGDGFGLCLWLPNPAPGSHGATQQAVPKDRANFKDIKRAAHRQQLAALNFFLRLWAPAWFGRERGGNGWNGLGTAGTEREHCDIGVGTAATGRERRKQGRQRRERRGNWSGTTGKGRELCGNRRNGAETMWKRGGNSGERGRRVRGGNLATSARERGGNGGNRTRTIGTWARAAGTGRELGGDDGSGQITGGEKSGAGRGRGGNEAGTAGTDQEQREREVTCRERDRNEAGTAGA